MEALNNSEKRIVGTKQVLRALKAGTLSKAYVANDADTFLFQRIVTAAEAAGVPVKRVGSMKELGQACHITVDTAAAGVLK
ncbi:MAG: ribosomal L7Ae/L30e/S12e/Gadd45 family protein [Clostridia bacterium]|nr:ribosomal L7Ae/L30e/S12e/Gadd45 family protein [Clostridia bacterium]